MAALQPVEGGLQQFFREPNAILLTVGIGLALVLVGIMIHTALSPAGRKERRQRREFREFAEANGLTGSEREVLLRVARQCHLDMPAFIFVRRSLFETSVPDMDVPDAEIRSIREKVYSP